MQRITVKDIRARKGQQKIVAVTAYDYSMAKLVDAEHVDILLVGDSLGMVCLGYESTVSVALRDMLHHTKAVSRGAKHGLIVADMPFGSFQHSVEKTLRHATRLLKEGGAQAVKVEGGSAAVAQKVAALKQADIPVMGHVGLTPQRATELGGYKVQGKSAAEAEAIRQEALRLQEAGAFAIVLECVPSQLARELSAELSVPTIGIGAGPACDGQVLVLYDLLGMQDEIMPRFVRQYAQVGQITREAVRRYREDVIGGSYPSQEESFGVLELPSQPFKEQNKESSESLAKNS